MEVEMCQVIEVIRCVGVEGDGTKGNPETSIIKYYHKDGRFIFETKHDKDGTE